MNIKATCVTNGLALQSLRRRFLGHEMLLASMLGSPQGGSGVSSSALQRQIAHATSAYGFHCQFKDSPMVVPTKQCECGNRFHTQCLSLRFIHG